MMSDQYQQSFTTTDGSNITYIQFVDPNDKNLIYKDEGEEHDEVVYYEDDQEHVEDSYIEEDPNDGDYEILEEVVVESKKNRASQDSSHEVTKRLVQVKDSGKPKGRKRMIPDQTRAIRKIRANTNKPYINAKGQEVKPKEFNEDFYCSCPKKCTDPKKLPLKMRRQIFNMFWSIGSYEGRCAFLNSCINELPKKRTYTKNKEASRRKMSRKYFLKGIEVCKTTFTKTLMISNSRIDVSLHKMETERFYDERGKKRIGQGFSEEKKEKIISHIKDNYESEASLRGMWTAYMNNNSDDPVSESYYKRMFYENFNLKIRKVVKKEVKPEQFETDD